MGLHEIKKSFCATKEMVSKWKRLLAEWEEIFVSYTSDKGLGKLKKVNSPKINDPIKKWTNELNRTFQRKKFKGRRPKIT
jgi:hypothetical protein